MYQHILLQSYALTQRGNRERNEDAIFPASEQQYGIEIGQYQAAVVCDGVGGLANGGTASRIAADAIGIWTGQQKDLLGYDFATNAVRTAYSALDREIAHTPTLKGMATTLTLVAAHSHGLTFVHVGDSRIYHIRNGQIIHQTTDHSLVAQLGLRGDAARTHHQKNVITRAIQAGDANVIQPDYFVQGDIQIGDAVFLCSDGVWETFTEQQLAALLARAATDPTNTMQHINTQCAQFATDNYSAYLLVLTDINGSLSPQEYGAVQLENQRLANREREINQIVGAHNDSPTIAIAQAAYKPILTDEVIIPPKNPIILPAIIIGVVMLFCGIFFITKQNDNPNKPEMMNVIKDTMQQKKLTDSLQQQAEKKQQDSIEAATKEKQQTTKAEPIAVPKPKPAIIPKEVKNNKKEAKAATIVVAPPTVTQATTPALPQRTGDKEFEDKKVK